MIAGSCTATGFYTEGTYFLKPGFYRYLLTLFFTGCVVLAIGCGMCKNTVTDLQKSHEQTTADIKVQSVEQKDWLSRSGSVSFYRDSSNFDYSIQIWPKGMFSFSPGYGFSGEADKVLVTGKSKAGSVSADLFTSVQQDKGKLQKEVISEKRRVSDQKMKIKKSAVSWKWVAAGFVLTGLAGCFVYRKLKLISKS